MSRLTLLMLFIFAMPVPFLASCGGADKFTLPGEESGADPSADESEGEKESDDDDESSSDGDITTTPDTPITGEEIEPGRDPFDDEGTHWCGDCEGDVACEICMD